MNRTFTLFLALAILLAHVLAIHDTDFDTFGPPYELAHVAFRLTRNLVWDGMLSWTPGGAGFDCYPSPLWMALLAASQRLYLGVSTASQTMGIVFALGTVVVASRFRPERVAGMIAPLLLVVNGGLGAAAASGTETALFAFEASLAFLWFDRGRRWPYALTCCALVMTRPEGALLVLGFLGLQLLEREGRQRHALAPYAPALACVLLIWCLRYVTKSILLSSISADLTHPTPDRMREGLEFLREFAVSQATPFLVVMPITYLAIGKLSRIGRTGLALALYWALIQLLEGGASLPFAQAMVPALPFLFVSVQAAFIAALDARPILRRTALGALALSLLVSALASRTPSNFAGIELVPLYGAWLGDGTSREYGFDRPMARAGLAQEIRNTRQLREVGLFLRDELAPDHSVLTPWPGAIGYLSHLEVVDLFGRTRQWPGQTHLNPWLRPVRVDVVDVLAIAKSDFVVFTIPPLARIPTRRELARHWLTELDRETDRAGRLDEIEHALGEYELVTVPLANQVSSPRPRQPNEYHLLRRVDLDLAPRLDVVIADGRYRVEAHHDGMRQIVDLRVSFLDERGREWAVRPDGGVLPATEDRPLQARGHLLLYPSDRPHVLMESTFPTLPSGRVATRLRARLVHPGSGVEGSLALVSNTVDLELEPGAFQVR